MTEIPEIEIPNHLLPVDGRFGSGPSRVRTTFLNDLADTGTLFMGTSHRAEGVRSVVGDIRSGLTEMYDLSEGYEVVLGVGGATAFWDAAVFGLIENRSAHFVCGEFSQKFATSVTVAPHLDEPVVITADFGDAPIPEEVAGVDTAAFIHNETSTGVLAPFARRGDALVTVDGTSAAGAIAFETTSVDAYYFSPQKALGSEGGLWIALFSPFAVERIEAVARSNRWIPPFLSLKTALDNSRNAQTYNTPALATLYLLARQIAHVNDSGGIGWADTVVRSASGHLYEWAEESEFAVPFVRRTDLRSPTVVTIDLANSVSANHVAGILRANGIVDTESYRKLGRNQLRIATFPNIPIEDIEALTASIDYVVGRL
ncbi:MAG: phosphoserine transaminase [Acidimicrobiia bacterium]|nr:MAG: phosphoserine transaminase [Acidimicrobiia bacterium]